MVTTGQACYNASSAHPYRLDDCILGKLNLSGRKPRRNSARQETAHRAWVQGFALALADLHRLLLHGNNSSGVCEIVRNAGMTLAKFRQAGVAAYDLRELRKAGVK